ncbi:MAG: hypothetical protein K9H49_17935 [Bacteroidales bacterium]|nr:hypothetical protein [Bacteroidales bacterium]MCF8391372.1 hypothetical protein [Bacteroidales bacterium]
MKSSPLIFAKIIFFVPAIRTLLFIVAGVLMLFLPSFQGKTLYDSSMWWPMVCIAVNIITILFLFFLVRKEGKRFRDLINPDPAGKISIKEILWATPIMLFLGIGGLMGFSWLIYGYLPSTNIQPLPVWAAIIVLVLLPLTIVFSELPFYLGYCAPRINKITNNEVFSIVYPLFFYALQHSFMPVLFDFKHILSRFLMFIPLLIMIGIWYSRKKDLVPLMAGHGFLDLLTGIQLLMVALYPSVYEMMNSTK